MLVLHLLFFLIRPYHIGHDQAGYLYAGRAMLDGQMPYVDFADTNPPLIMYLAAIPALLERNLPLHVIPIWSLLVWSILVWSSLTVRHLLAKNLRGTSDRVTDALPLVVAGFSLFLLYESPSDYGQREHLFVLLCFPWMLARWMSSDGQRLTKGLAVFLGAAAAVGASLKPHFLLVALAPEAWWLATRRQYKVLSRPEMVSFGAVGAAYALHFLFLPERVKEALFSWIAPLMMAGYDAYDGSTLGLVTAPVVLLAGIGTIPLLIMLRGEEAQGSRKLVRPLAAATIASLAVFVLQNKNWAYQAIPASFFLLLLLALIVLDGRLFVPLLFGHRAVRSASEMLLRRDILAAACVAVLVRKAAILFVQPAPAESMAEQYLRENTRRGDSVLILDSSVSSAFPLLLNLNLRSGSRYHWAFPVPMIYRDVPRDEAGRPDYQNRARTPENIRFLGELAEDLSNRKPRFVLVNTSDGCQGCPPGFNFLSYLEEMGFRDTALFRYRLDVYLGDPAGKIFAVFKRESP